jgi:UDP-N-acetylmuramate: L-alanyl-gamma-D-glutamyl-meso-diaminopimelate ligase
MKHIHIIGICGTFMGSLAILAKQAGFKVTGCDLNVYPPMSTQLQAHGIELTEGFSAHQVDINPDIFVIGNVVSRGNPLMEEILNRNLPYTSGPQWLSENILKDKWVLAVAGTHGKTTTASMLTWVLEHAGFNPSYLIGGVPHNFSASARLTDSMFFVIEADEYDTAFFDKRSKFVHYRPKTLIFNNLEYDHADIFADLAAIQTQFHHAVRLVPKYGEIIVNRQNSLKEVIEKGTWSPVVWFNDDNAWHILPADTNQSATQFAFKGEKIGELNWQMLGRHNQENALAVILAAKHVGIQINQAIQALSVFSGVKRRMEIKGTQNNITVYDDFAHHPTAIATTIQGLRRQLDMKNTQQESTGRLIAILEPRSNTMKMGAIKDMLPDSLIGADYAFVYGAKTGKDAITWSLENTFLKENHPVCTNHIQLHDDFDQLLQSIAHFAKPHDHLLFMSNGSFNGIHQKILDLLSNA